MRVYKLQITNYKNMLVPAIYIDATFVGNYARKPFILQTLYLNLEKLNFLVYFKEDEEERILAQ